MSDAVTFDQHEIRCPTFTPDEVRALVRDRYGIEAADLKPLNSFQDQNFRVADPAGRRFVLKIANAHETFETLDLQNQAMRHIVVRDAGFFMLYVVPALDGAWITTAERAGERHFVRLLTYLPGQTLVEVKATPPTLLDDIGDTVGHLSAHLADFTHPAGDRLIQWDLRRAKAVVNAWLKYVAEAGRRSLIERLVAHFEAAAEPELPGLRRSIIHGDIVDYNLLVGRDGFGPARVTGLIDFGDTVYSYTIGELAVLLATVIAHNREAPLAAAARVVGRYHRVFPLTEAELSVLFPLVCLRVCATTTSAAQQAALEPDNAYVAEFAELEWPTLELLGTLSPDLAQAFFRHACGLEPDPRSPAVRGWLAEHAAEIGPAAAVSLTAYRPVVLDLGVGSDDLRDGAWERPGDVRALIRARAAGSGVVIGRYGEARLPYTRGDADVEPGTVHLGVDVFLPDGSGVLAPLPGVVERVGPGEVVLRHAPEGGPVFYTRLAGVTASVAAGQRLERGDRLGKIAPAPEAGPLPAHLHVQIACGLPQALPGLVPGGERDVWLSVCPDPNLILKVPGLAPAHDAPDTDRLIERRRQSLAQSQETYYRRPMQIVRGWRQYLIDAGGRAYLDAINNVAHVGHGHPRVAAAVARQMALLNTNSRFLYASLVEYAERLKALMPASLGVVFFVCSGSEANDLALRLARAYTGREDVLSIDGAYHGNTQAVYEVSTSLLDNPLDAKNTKPYVHPVVQPNTYRGPYRTEDPEAGRKYAADVAAKIAHLHGQGRAPAAFIGECLLGAPGGMLPPAGYFPEVYRLVRAAGGVCIADEVQVGFGRMGAHFWAFEMQGVVPDIVTMGKPMGNGFPVSAVITTAEIAEAFRRKTTYFNTFGGNPVACVAGMAVLEVMRDEGLQDNARDVGAYFQAQLEALKDRRPLIGAVYGHGLYLGVDLVLDRETRRPATAAAMAVCERMRDLGVIVYPTGDDYNILKIKPPLVFTRANADFFVEMLDRVLGEMI